MVNDLWLQRLLIGNCHELETLGTVLFSELFKGLWVPTFERVHSDK